MSLHRYLYANASPVTYRDPTGQFSVCEVMISLSIQGKIGGLISGGITFAITKDVRKSLVSAGTGFAIGVVTGGIFKLVKIVLAARSIAAAEMAAEDIIITEGKIGYLLGATGGKAVGFEMLGFTSENPELLREMLASTRYLVDDAAEAVVKTTTEFGTKYEVVAGIVGPNGKEGLITVVWQVDKGSSVFRLITAIAKPMKIVCH